MTKAFLVGATSSGVGKTSFCAGLGFALRKRGLRVRFCKAGPDYLDPSWLAVSSGFLCGNLDLWMHGEMGVRERFQNACADADICIVEGVMGLYDGVHPNRNLGSSADLANILGIPVLLLADAKGCARSLAAMVHGFATFPGAPKFLGCIANRSGSVKHGLMLGESIASVPHVGSFFGAIPHQAFPPLKSRHLGLHMASRNSETEDSISLIAQALEQHIAIDRLLEVLPERRDSTFKPLTPISRVPKCRIAMAQDEAFCFYYPEWVEALRFFGADVIPFSPLHDSSLPESCDGLLLGGGYPELYCKQLTMNHSMRASIQDHAKQNKSIYAECGGFMYLSQGIETAQGRFPMLGILPSWTRMQDRLHRLGYVKATLSKDCLIGEAGDVLRGHEFHYSHLASDPEGWECAYSCTDPHGSNTRQEGWSHGKILASYIHLPMDVFPKAMDLLIRNTQKGH